ncbi:MULTISPECIES: hypothetical protein [unclassified Herbaspirillum]|uniref:hypothetical protein n=1 Tax=unclassified Herbaspirillum TaxID=2624150 RepID=UPI000E2FC021|nr:MULTISPECIES: hypothetical protein [unclassified Herbaspirillum]RFB65673.1 hypothetical protein DZB54_22835 [Herbaspirillum sp. 3R-3a1]TFI09025.1 hypothetical protein E4P32_12960 [Herbaspirillum sp. 3R11]TFI15443.1 hypothetical protein E4P31_12960 [Herbaspirillum sp. 3R-11]TFI31787.1 hypothetical protein E4P30_01330 [Herbaspirillum sp. 3C11]
MQKILISYSTRPERADENADLIRDVFDELRKTAPEGLRYMALRAANGQFFHFLQAPEGVEPFAQSEAFASFQWDIRTRLLAPAQRLDVTVVGSYGMTDDDS